MPEDRKNLSEILTPLSREIVKVSGLPQNQGSLDLVAHLIAMGVMFAAQAAHEDSIQFTRLTDIIGQMEEKDPLFEEMGGKICLALEEDLSS